MYRSTVGLAAVIAMLTVVPAASAATITLVTDLTQGNEVPPTGSPATGRATVTIDTVAHTMQVDATFSGLQAGTTAAHIHCCLATPFATGVNVGVATTVPAFTGFPLGVTSGNYSMVLSLLDPTTYNPAFVSSAFNPSGTIAGAEAVLVAAISAGKTYFNIHTTLFPGGEIRGFLAPTQILAAVLPNARTTTVGTPVTAFASIINTGGATATGCSIALPPGVPATFHYQRTNAANAPIGTQDTPFDIAAGATQTTFFSLTPTATFSQDIALVFQCTNTSAAPVTSGVDTFMVSVGSTPIMDMLSIADTLTHDGIVHIPGTTGTGVIATAAINIGAAGTVTCTATPTPAGQPARTLAATLAICQTSAQATPPGGCFNPPTPGASSTVTVANGATVFFSIFATGLGQPITFAPATRRIFLVCTQGTTPVGEASVAACTGTVAPGAANCN